MMYDLPNALSLLHEQQAKFVWKKTVDNAINRYWVTKMSAMSNTVSVTSIIKHRTLHSREDACNTKDHVGKYTRSQQNSGAIAVNNGNIYFANK